jgi:hypothetical protein
MDVACGATMTVYVDDANIPFRGMLMSHLWADTLPELLAMVDAIGVQRRWLQRPPKASWVHFDISLGKKKLAIARGAVLMDKYGPAEHEARRKGDQETLDRIARLRAQYGRPPVIPHNEKAEQREMPL